jgi:DNA-binding Lrp family transcriptional regulator
MAQTRSPERADDVVRRRLADIHAWRAQGQSLREMAERLDLSTTTFYRALKRVEAEKIEAKEHLGVDEGIPETQALTKVYEGIHISTSDRDLALPEELARLVPAMQKLQDLLPVLTIMAKEWTEHQSLQQIPDEYKKYGATYSVRLNERLIQDIKKYADDHRLSQSAVITLAVQQLLARR